MAEPLKKILVGTFYALQGLGHLIYALFIFRIESAHGGGGVAGLEIMTRTFLEVTSCLSLLTALSLFLPRARELRREDRSVVLGTVTSVLFGWYYGWWMVLIGNTYIVKQYYSPAVIVLLLMLMIVVLNVVSVWLLAILYRNR